MTPREFRQEQEFNYDHFIELTKTGINPNYVNIELFAQEYHKAKLNLLTIPVVVQQSEQLICTFELGVENCGFKSKDVFTCKHLRKCDMCAN